MRVLVLPNFQKHDCLNVTNTVIEVLKKGKTEILALTDTQKYLQHDFVSFISPDQINADIDLAVTIGGDGTIIKAANLLLEYEIPLIGVNLGTLGFLAGIEKNEINLLSSVIEGNYTIDERMTLQVSICHQDGTQNHFTAINDIVICKNAFSGIIDLDIFCGNIETAHYRADGVIFSTSSGSTAYAMSAGGPIIHPYVKAISLTPICAHSLLARTIVLPEYETINIKVNADSVRKKVFVVADGLHSVDVVESDVITIHRYNKNIKFLCLKGKNYYSAINKKLMER